MKQIGKWLYVADYGFKYMHGYRSSKGIWDRRDRRERRECCELVFIIQSLQHGYCYVRNWKYKKTVFLCSRTQKLLNHRRLHVFGERHCFGRRVEYHVGGRKRFMREAGLGRGRSFGEWWAMRETPQWTLGWLWAWHGSVDWHGNAFAESR